MQRQERLALLADYILEQGSVQVDQVCEHFGTSAATVRRDLDALAAQQLVVRTRGGAMVNKSSADLPLRYRSVRRGAQKNAIAVAAAAMVRPGEVIAFNGGTTTTMAAYEVGIRAAAADNFQQDPTTVVTNAVNIANDLVVRPQLRVVVTGGVARARSYELVGPLSALILPQINIDTLFLGVTAIDLGHGIYTHHEGEAAVNAELIRAARRTVVLADSSKFNATSFARIADLGEVSLILTDSDVPREVQSQLSERGIECVLT